MVDARRRKGELHLVKMTKERRERVRFFAEHFCEVAHESMGVSYDEFDERCKAVDIAPRERKMAAAVRKLVEDGLAFEVSSPAEPRALREEVFLLAAERRRAATPEAPFEREAILEEVGARYDLDSGAIERALYGDLKGAQVLTEARVPRPEHLVQSFQEKQAQAVLLRAVQLRAEVRPRDAAAARELFRRLKFRRLLHRIERGPGDVITITIDGPYSLFESVTKYGLALALALPALLATGPCSIAADVRWGKERRSLLFKLESKGGAGDDEPARLAPEVDKLLARFDKRKTPWKASPSEEVFDVAGVGVCVPDLVFTHDDSGARVYLEVMGYWSRDAVFRRVELVEAGLDAPILFAASTRLRVAEELLPDDAPSALYLYKGSLKPAEIEERLNALAARG